MVGIVMLAISFSHRHTFISRYDILRFFFFLQFFPTIFLIFEAFKWHKNSEQIVN